METASSAVERKAVNQEGKETGQWFSAPVVNILPLIIIIFSPSGICQIAPPHHPRSSSTRTLLCLYRGAIHGAPSPCRHQIVPEHATLYI